MLSLQRQVQHRRCSHLRHFSASHLRQGGTKIAHVQHGTRLRGTKHKRQRGDSQHFQPLVNQQVQRTSPDPDLPRWMKKRPIWRFCPRTRCDLRCKRVSPSMKRLRLSPERGDFNRRNGFVAPEISEVLLIDTVGDILVDNVQSSAFARKNI